MVNCIRIKSLQQVFLEKKSSALTVRLLSRVIFTVDTKKQEYCTVYYIFWYSILFNWRIRGVDLRRIDFFLGFKAIILDATH